MFLGLGCSLRIWPHFSVRCGLRSVVGIATDHGLDGPGIESQWGQDFLHLSRPALGPTQPPVQWVPGLSRGVNSGRGVTLTPHPLLVPCSWKCRPIPLLPLWAVRPVQSLSACTRGALYAMRMRCGICCFFCSTIHSFISIQPLGRFF